MLILAITILDIIHRPLLFKTHPLGDWIMYPSSDCTYTGGLNRQGLALSIWPN
jgi:hypothetical protein